ncbi:adenosylhomocysteinase [Actinoplanes teichomyceticus]|uniref:Adenosylhomocysteinase n=1 Tax=Actinoplanes teichomyceticus TaxID=1867 RepID=A0A561VIM6_ACTTI|nr:adenosylhomocysteinase [Actinoplanes teichomyceticus]TWG11471.1 adenosylhomocysteinase [Actinoplanes teichomyceticus]GIF15715.1 adenosylhomocysteinase [Actinoplanes teichomyceticus]
MSMVRDLALADEGGRKIAFAGRRMPVLSALVDRFAETKPFVGQRIAACLHVTTETANMCRALVAGGAELSLCASNPLSTKDDVAAAIQRDIGAEVFAIHGCDRDTFYRQVQGVLDVRPTVVVDDGADLTTTIHNDYPQLLDDIIGGTEVTSTGVLRIRNMATDGALRYPVLPTNDAATKHLFDNRYGTGQNTIDGILRATNVLIAGSTFVVIGYGWCGRGVAARARGMGARVIVTEVDPIRALEAKLDGFEVMPMMDAAERGDVFVTVTGNRDAITLDHMRRMRDGAILANSGHFDVEIAVADLTDAAVERRELRPNCVEYVLPSGPGIILLAEGRLVGQSAAEAHPAEVMDMTFATQALALQYLVANAGRLQPGIVEIPRAVEDEVARAKLTAYGVRIDELSPGQQQYLTDWRVGT